VGERVDIYTQDRVNTGETREREGLRLGEGEYMLYVLAVVEDAKGRVLITRRALDKHWAPGAWEVPGGGAGAGETSAQAVVREVREEVGLDVSGLDLTPAHSYRNDDLERGDNYIVDIYRFSLCFDASDVRLQHSEAIDARLATWDEVAALAVEGEFLHYERLQQARASERWDAR